MGKHNGNNTMKGIVRKMSRIKNLDLPYGIKIYLDGQGSGRITSSLRMTTYAIKDDVSAKIYDQFVSCLEQMILTHAIKHINVTSKKYQAGIDAAIDMADSLWLYKVNIEEDEQTT